MNTLAKREKNGSLANKSMVGNYPTWSSWIDEMFSNDLPSVFKSNFNTGLSLPKVNISETDDSFSVHLAAPGMKKDDFKVEIDNQVLSISSEMNSETSDNGDTFTRKEFEYASFSRSFTLPESVDSESIKASYADGILKLTLPKKEEAKKKPARTIKIS